MENLLNNFVDISIRIKPQNEHESNNTCIEVLNKNPAVLLVLDKSQTYHFDNIFDNETNQENIYNDTVKPLLDKVKAGYNCTVFSYGQTGTGKTYTMGTNPDVTNENEKGLIPRTLEDLFSWETSDTEISISVSFIEIYNEKVFDLLANERKIPLSIKGFNIQGFNKEIVYSSSDAKRILKMGILNRHIAETKLNANSSRSHAIFTIYCNIRNCDNETEAKLNLVDLAGSESVRKTGNQGSTFQEGVNINKGLLCVGQVMTALTNNSTHIPYRQSIITTILQDSLNKRNYISLIACISSNLADSSETVRTLEFANRVKKMKNKPEVNQIITKFKKDNPSLFINQSKLFTTPQLSNRIRPVNSMYTTPFKKSKLMCSVPESQETINSITDSPKSLFSLSVSSVSNEAINKQINYSPVIKKCFSIMEDQFLNNLENVITRTLKKAEANACIVTTKRDFEDNKENSTPTNLHWNKIKNEVSKMVRNEISQLTASVSRRAASSPIESIEDRISLPKRVINYDQEITSPINNNEDFDESSKEIFKVPEIPTKKLKNKIKIVSSSSPVKLRKSLRLQLNTLVNDKSLDINDNDTSVNSTTITSDNNKRPTRRSARISVINKNKTPTIEDNKKINNKIKSRLKLTSKDSLKTVHSIHVLNTLNKGTIKELGKLHSIGMKTAEKILLFRQLNGQFGKISDLASMPGWSGNRYKSFLSQNFLKDVK